MKSQRKNIARLTGSKIAKIGLVQVWKAAIFSKLTVEKISDRAFTRSIPNRSRGFEEDIQTVPRLEERRTQTGGTLSGGEQQMLAIGQALITNPKDSAGRAVPWSGPSDRI